MAIGLEQRLVDAGRALLEERGIEAVTIREVARRCGVSHGAPRRYYPTITLLLAAIAEGCMDELRDSIDASGDGLMAMAVAYVRYAADRPDAFELITRHDVLNSSGRGLRAVSLSLLDNWCDCCLRENPDFTKERAIALWASVHGVAALSARRALEVVSIAPEFLLKEIIPSR
ncbi:TetR/AcrR family transcriptional regulator [Corynebacterium lowii]|uniref:TetR/AcrR family transcriptional regulator n=1 Tax=Corynebacterium lowii TaxID=1544413 RepID=UPI0009ECACE0|nr:TetR/AcrR family transcriptional regulator [Corynebacterium lowii]MDP9851918.1 AcrR family transcriptional regulator [Corynebacterium lowii]